MQRSQKRLICRAINSYNPSVALWHFVAPNRPTPHQQRHSSSATEPVQDGADASSANANGTPLGGGHNSEDGPGTAEDAGAEPKGTNTEPQNKSAEPAWGVRRMTTARGQKMTDKTGASIRNNLLAQEKARKAGIAESEALLAVARAAFDEAKDYDGVVVKPMQNARPVKESDLPWSPKKEERPKLGIDRLNIEIERFYNYTKPDRFESIARRHLIEQVREHVREGLRGFVVEVFGSERTGIALATSDIDFRLLPTSMGEKPAEAKKPPSLENRRQATGALYRLLHVLQGRHQNRYLLLALRHARYPLISAQDQQSGLDIQIVSSNDTSVSRVIMQGYMEEYPYLCQLYYVVKSIFDVRGLSDVFRGGFGSYSLFMMLVASLKHAPHPRNDAAGGLINFLKFWRDFDTRQQGVSIEPALLFDKAEELIATERVKNRLSKGEVKPLPEYMLSLRDPADATNDLGRKGIAIKHVQVTFRHLSAQLEFDMRINTRPSLIGHLVGAAYMNDYARRQKLHKYGERVLVQMQKDMAAKAKAVREAEKMEVVNAEKRAELEKQAEEEATKQKLAKEERDREWQKLSDERNKQNREEAQRSSVLEHGEAMASILGMPAVEEEAHQKEDSAAQGQEESRKI